ncbi:MAG: bifunctional precorrin-2 dehydrogenase/sirohydrochlorin ferrochelatase [Chloroflexi bacterium]|nr:bifunctional precorrin-2 dehydrogenase/sirohydrochlorin ferrochelatase [Chloroflexota bacterium]
MKNNSSAIYYPVFLNLKDKKCVVIGGGPVALRKAVTLLESGAKVTVVSPELCPELASLAEKGEIEFVPREYRKGDLKGVFVAIAATDSSIINGKVAAEARAKSVLVNVVDDAGNSDFIAPSIIRRGEITIAISTSGQSPALARKLRTVLEKEFGEEYARLGRLIGEVRAEVRKQKITVDGDGWQAALDLDRLLELIKKGDETTAKTTLLNNLKAEQE